MSSSPSRLLAVAGVIALAEPRPVAASSPPPFLASPPVVAPSSTPLPREGYWTQKLEEDGTLSAAIWVEEGVPGYVSPELFPASSVYPVSDERGCQCEDPVPVEE